MNLAAFQKIVVDECVGRASPLVEHVQKLLGGRSLDYLFLSDAHPGIPDVEILGKILNIRTLLITEDRVLHNRALAAGFASITMNQRGKPTRKRLSEVEIGKGPPQSRLKELRTDYRDAPSDAAEILRQGMSERELKRWRTARRRIRSYFGSSDNIARVAVTVGQKRTRTAVFCGYFLKTSGHNERKAIQASEGYCQVPIAEFHPPWPVLHALRAGHLLHLHQIPTELFVIPKDTHSLTFQVLAAEIPKTGNSVGVRALAALVRGMPSMAVSACAKGPFHDRMERKLAKLALGTSNEVRKLDFAAMADLLVQPGLANSADDG